MLVTAFLCYKNGKSRKTTDHYISQFDHIARLGIPTILFLDESLRGKVNYPHVHVEYITIDDLWISQFIKESEIPPNYIINGENTTYVSSEYFVIQNSKSEFLSRAAAISPDQRFTWIDFGVAHVFPGYEHILQRLKLVDYLQGGLIIPGYHGTPTDELRELPWRFLGGFITGLRDDIAYFHDHQVRAFKAIYPFVTFEVNVWAWAEVHQGFKPKWYWGNFGPYFFNFDQYLVLPKTFETGGP
jgi:hypothetical protein